MDRKMLAAYREVYEWAEQAQRPGGEFDWYCYDCDGSVAAFATAGFGPVPVSVFNDGVDSFLRLVEVIENELPHTTELLGGEFQPYADRGLFSYDFKAFESGQYELEAEPQVPTKLTTILDLGISATSLVEYPGKFSRSRVIVQKISGNVDELCYSRAA